MPYFIVGDTDLNKKVNLKINGLSNSANNMPDTNYDNVISIKTGKEFLNAWALKNISGELCMGFKEGKLYTIYLDISQDKLKKNEMWQAYEIIECQNIVERWAKNHYTGKLIFEFEEGKIKRIQQKVTVTYANIKSNSVLSLIR